MKTSLISSLALSALLMAGCSQGAGAGVSSSTPTVAPAGPSTTAAATPTTTSAAPAPAAAAPATTAAATSPRGNLIKTVGQTAGQTYNGQTTVTFVVKSIEVDAKCSSSFYTPKGHIVVMTVDAETTPALANDPMKSWALNMFAWKAIADNGTTVNGTPVAVGCLDSAEQLPSMGPAEKATGKIAFDLPSAAGTLIYTIPGETSGWEWAYPAK
jgi:predicted small secreted protein